MDGAPRGSLVFSFIAPLSTALSKGRGRCEGGTEPLSARPCRAAGSEAPGLPHPGAPRGSASGAASGDGHAASGPRGRQPPGKPPPASPELFCRDREGSLLARVAVRCLCRPCRCAPRAQVSGRCAEGRGRPSGRRARARSSGIPRIPEAGASPTCSSPSCSANWRPFLRKGVSALCVLASWERLSLQPFALPD